MQRAHHMSRAPTDAKGHRMIKALWEAKGTLSCHNNTAACVGKRETGTLHIPINVTLVTHLRRLQHLWFDPNFSSKL